MKHAAENIPILDDSVVDIAAQKLVSLTLNNLLIYGIAADYHMAPPPTLEQCQQVTRLLLIQIQDKYEHKLQASSVLKDDGKCK